MIEELENAIKPYAWGSRTAIAQLLGAPAPSAEPQAELWMGAHPLGPSKLSRDGRTLLSAIEQDPRSLLGPAVQANYGPKLPFLLKLLAAASPLSLQAHPSISQAESGFAADEAKGIALDSPLRNYKDRSHKPELLCALTEFWALCGFRAVPDTLSLFEDLAVPELDAYLEPLQKQPDAAGIQQAFSGLVGESLKERKRLAELTTAACSSRLSVRFAAELSWGARLGELYPGDIGVVVALLLNLVRLKPGQAIYLPAGNLHAYLEGLGVEIMASSDNVLRGGLTPKHVDVPELLRVLDFSVLKLHPLRPQLHGAESVYETSAREFQLSRFELQHDSALNVAVKGPEIWFVTTGRVELGSGDCGLQLSRGQSAFVSADVGPLSLRGAGQVFRACVP